MDIPVSQRQSKSYSVSFIKGLVGLGLVIIILSLTFATAQPVIVYAQGIKGYVVGSNPVAAYACPDTNTAKCPIKLSLQPGTEVLIVDNVVGSTVPGLNDNAWRKIVYQGQTLFVPLRYISINPPNNSSGDAQDISFVQTSHEDDSTSAPPPGNFSTVPTSKAVGIGFCPGGCPPICPTGTYGVTFFTCCPIGYVLDTSKPVVFGQPGTCILPPPVTWYTATDGRINGNAGDRIAIYCRKSGRIEVWSINDSQGRFLVEFNHTVVDAAGRAGLRIAVGNQGVVTIGGDGQGQYWASIYGGPNNASGTGDFAKTFNCYVH
jgi:hypothetical protein